MGRLDHELVNGQLTADPERVAHAIERLEVVSCELAAGDALFLHCKHATWFLQKTRRSEAATCCSAATNAVRNDPYKDHHMPRYTPLKKLPDSAVKERSGVYAGADRRFMLSEDIPENQLSFAAPDAS